jgi:FixJ family two-component response regulator
MEARALGAMDVIEKPPDLEDLVQKIKKAKRAQKKVRKKNRHN